MNSILMVAAEASSVIYAQRILENLKAKNIDVKAFGVGSRQMEELGFERLGKSEEMAIVGAAEIISHFGLLKSVFDGLVKAAAERKPKVAIVMDYPEFNLMLSKKLHALGIPVIYYISPQVWAWRKGRVHTIKKYCEKALLLFPFEIPFYSKHAVPHEFVGHPILDELDEKLLDPQYRILHRNQCGITDQEIVLGLMPGSRRLELKQHFAIQLETARQLSHQYKNLKILIMVAPSFEKEDLYPYLEDFKLPYMMIKDEPFRMIHLCDFILATSGTATLMVGLLKKPMVIIYRMKALTAIFAKLIVRGTKYFGLVNLILQKEVAPERFQGDALPKKLVPLFQKYIDDPDYAESVRQQLGELRHHLGEKGATERVTGIIQRYLFQ